MGPNVTDIIRAPQAPVSLRRAPGAIIIGGGCELGLAFFCDPFFDPFFTHFPPLGALVRLLVAV